MCGKKNGIIFLCTALGVALFAAIYGINTLDVTYDSWIFNGYIETDIVQRYAGWLAYRENAHFFPLTFSALVAYPFGAYTSLADSMPLVEIFFKILNPVLPNVFQFCGIVCCFNMAMQALSAAKLMCLFTDENSKIIMGSIFFCLSPVLLERFFRHTSLSFHWLIVLSIYLYIAGCRKPRTKISVAFLGLAVLSVWLHLYFTPMILGFFTAYLLDCIVHKKIKAHQCKGLFFTLALCLFSAKVLGILDLGIDNTSGYGTMGMNLNALFNPVSLGSDWWVEGKGKLDWSLLLPMRALAKNNIEGFNYLGAGVLLGLCLLFVRVIFLFVKNRKRLFEICRKTIKNHGFLLVFLVFSTAFAVSNTICAFSFVLMQVPLPTSFLKICNAFRASGRLFWSVNYMLVTVVVVQLFQVFKNKKRLNTLLLIAVLAIQIADLSPVLMEKNAFFRHRAPYYNQTYTDAVLETIGSRKTVYYLEIREDRALCGQLLKKGIANNLLLISRDGYGIKEQTEQIQTVKEALLQGKHPYENCVYATSDAALASEVAAKNAMLSLKSVQNTYFLISN